MKKLTKFAVLSVVTLLALPGVAMAAGEVHPAPTEKGYTTHPDHKTAAPQSRDRVKADLAAAKKDGSADRIARSLPLPDKSAGPAKTRQEVKDEVKNETAEQRRKRLAEMKGGN